MVLILKRAESGPNWIVVTLVIALIILLFSSISITGMLRKSGGQFFDVACKYVKFPYLCKDREYTNDGKLVKPAEKELAMCYDRFNQMLRELEKNQNGIQITYTKNNMVEMFVENIRFVNYTTIDADGRSLTIYRTDLGSRQIPVYLGIFNNNKQIYVFKKPKLELGAHHFTWDGYKEYILIKNYGGNYEFSDNIEAEIIIMLSLNNDCRDSWLGRSIGADLSIKYGQDVYGLCTFPIKKEIDNAPELKETDYEKEAKKSGCDIYG